MAQTARLVEQVEELGLVEGPVLVSVKAAEHVGRLVETVGTTGHRVVVLDELVEVDRARAVRVRLGELGRQRVRVGAPRREALAQQRAELVGCEQPVLVLVEVVEHGANALQTWSV